MARISGADIPNEKRLDIGLTYIYGIGRKTARIICEQTELDPSIRCKDLTDAQIAKLREYIEKHCTVEGDLRKKVSLDIKALTEINSYRGSRHKKHLPCRGQSTHSNARTLKGRRGGGKK